MSYTRPEDVRLRTFSRTPAHYAKLFSSESTKFAVPPENGFGIVQYHGSPPLKKGHGRQHQWNHNAESTVKKAQTKKRRKQSPRKKKIGERKLRRRKKTMTSKSKYTLF